MVEADRSMSGGAGARVFARVGRARMVVRAPDPGAVVPSAQKVLADALEEVAEAWPTAWIFVRRMELALRARGASSAVDERSLVRSIVQGLQRRIDAMRQGLTTGAEVGDEVVWFPDEGSARGALLGRLLRGQGLDWPYSSMGWAKSLDDVASWPTPELGDALAHAIGHAAEPVRVPEATARAWSDRWLASGTPTIDLARLPDEVRERLAGGGDLGDVDDVARLRTLARLFAEWPPAREAHIDPRQLDELAGQTPDERPPRTLPSRAGGLVAWEALLTLTGVGDALWSSMPDERARRAARWVVARALEAGDVGDGDPILRLWSGQPLDGPPLARWVLDEIDPEPLHAAAIRVAAARGWLDAELVLARLGDDTVAVAGGDLCVDTLPAPPDDALPAIVRRFAARAGRPPVAVAIAARLDDVAVDAVAEVDVMALPDRWRSAARAVASVARRIAAETWHVDLRALRKWPARIEVGDPIVLEIPSSRAERLPLDLASTVSALHGARIAVRLV